LDDIPSRARALRVGWIALLVLVLILAATPVSAKKNKHAKGRYRLPVARKFTSERKLRAWHHDYPAWDIAIPMRRAVKAVHAGRVQAVTRWGACGKGVIIRGADGFQYTYCHGSGVNVKKHRWVKAGQQIMRSGNSGHSTGPHLHLQIRGPRGALICPQPLLRRWARGKQVSPRSGTSRGCAYGPDLARYRKTTPAARRGRGGRAVKNGSRGVKPAPRKAAGRGGRKSTHRARPRAERRDGAKGGKAAGGRGRSKRAGKSKRRNEREARPRSPGSRGGERSSKRRHLREASGPERQHRRRVAARRRARARERQRAETIRRRTAARRAELALADRVRPLI